VTQNRPVLTQIDLFSGIGGFLLAGERSGFTPILGCEIEPFCRAILADNFPGLPITEDVHDLKFTESTAPKGAKQPYATLLTGGFPFQTNYSRGEVRRNDPRSLWDQFARIAGEIRPDWVVVETVPRLANLGLDDACWDLERGGYALATVHIPAQALDCPLRKDRLFLVGSRRGDPQLLPGIREGFDLRAEPWEPPGPHLHRVAERFPNGLDWHVAALQALGDATVPRVAEAILRSIRETELAWRTESTASNATS